LGYGEKTRLSKTVGWDKNRVMSTTRLKKSNKLRFRNTIKLKSHTTKKTVSRSITFRYNIEKSIAKSEIQNFVNKHPWSLTSEIIEQLRIEPPLAINVLKELKKEGLTVSKPVV
jgi:CDP-glycerol glycerophosphotransferase (TagB/SpsB family)